jgi:hypothetical protein
MNAEGLSTLIAYLIEVAGNPVKAADACGIPGSRALLYDLIRGARKELTHDSVRNLQKGLDAYDLPFRIEEFLSSPSETISRKGYEEWQMRAARALVLEPNTSDDDGPNLRPSGARRREFLGLIARLEKLRPGALNEFVARAIDAGHDQGRVALAVHRVFEPLLQVRASGYVEIGSEELTDAEYIRFITSGLQREKLLLKRSPDLNRLRDGDQRRKERTTRNLVDSANKFMRIFEAPKVRQKRWGIGDALGGVRYSNREYQPNINDLVAVIPKALWPSAEPQREEVVVLDARIELCRKERAASGERRRAREAARALRESTKSS